MKTIEELTSDSIEASLQFNEHAMRAADPAISLREYAQAKANAEAKRWLLDEALRERSGAAIPIHEPSKLDDRDLLVRIRDRANDAPMPTERLLDDAADEIERLRSTEKLATHLQETNDVLIERIRQLEIKLEKAEKALAVEREECARVAEGYTQVAPYRSPQQSSANYEAAQTIAQLIRERAK